MYNKVNIINIKELRQMIKQWIINILKTQKQPPTYEQQWKNNFLLKDVI